ncbi:MAG: hypothetical protein EA393_04035 [Bacteroidetes bacterium]|nr:MAG: hypothetical protein EA393_04035 [Bacteroidota bacterium]
MAFFLISFNIQYLNINFIVINWSYQVGQIIYHPYYSHVTDLSLVQFLKYELKSLFLFDKVFPLAEGSVMGAKKQNFNNKQLWRKLPNILSYCGN